MASIPTSVANPVESVAILEESRACFAAMVASGLSYRVAAVKAGFSEDYGWDLMQEPAIRQRVIEIATEPMERLRAGLEADLLMMRRAAASGPLDEATIATMELRLKLLMAQAKLRGWIVDKKQVAKATINLGGLNVGEVQEQIAGLVDELDPESRGDIEDKVRALEARRRTRRRLNAPARTKSSQSGPVQDTSGTDANIVDAECTDVLEDVAARDASDGDSPATSGAGELD